jgi:hypothetical protein
VAFVIAIPATDLPRDPGQLSYQFILLPTKVTVNPRDLYSRDLWIIVRYDAASYLWCKLNIMAVEEIREGEYLHGYLLSGDLERSEYLIRPPEKREALRVNSLVWCDEEGLQNLTEIDREQEGALQRLASDFVQTKMVKPNAKVIDAVWRPSGNKFEIGWLGSIVRQLKLKYTVGELYRFHTSPRHWSPYESFALSYLEEKFPAEVKTLLLPGEITTRGPTTEYMRSVDTVMRGIDPNRVKVRKFVNPPEAEIDDAGLDAYLKTERADAFHQMILAELARRIILLGQRPMESNSIDLFTEGTKSSVLIEVKSANDLTYYRQCMKGTMQLLEYAYCLKTQQNVECKLAIVMQSIENDRLKEYMAGLVRQVHIMLFNYDERQDWPERVSGFDSLIKSIR